MYPKAIQNLATLEVLLETPLSFRLPCHEDSAMLSPWFWDRASHGCFSPLTLAQREGWMQWTDPEVAIETWQIPEQQGVAVPSRQSVYHDEKSLFLGESERDRRAQVYADLLTWCNQNLQDQLTFWMRSNLDYTWVVVLGKQADGRWLAIAPTVPKETPGYVTAQNIPLEDRRNHDRDIIAAAKPEPAADRPSDPTLVALLQQLPNIKIYGWYDGGYNITHDYQLHAVLAPSESEAIAAIFRRSGFLQHYSLQSLAPGEQLYGNGDEARQIASNRFAGLNRFLREACSPMELYCFCLWDREFLYFVSDEQLYGTGDRIGFSLRSQFTYNP